MRTRGIPPLAKPEISRFPRKELPHMPGSWTTPGRAAARAIAPVRVAFRAFEHVGTQVAQVFAAQWLAYVLPYRRFANTLASANARLRAGADRYSFTVGDFHLLLLAGLPGAPKVLISGYGRFRVDWGNSSMTVQGDEGRLGAFRSPALFFYRVAILLVWTVPDGIECARMRLLLTSDKGDRPWSRLAELGWIRRNTFSSFTE